MAQTVKNQPAMQETRVQSLGREDTLEKDTATHSSTLAWKNPWTEEPEATVHGVPKSWTRLSDFTYASPKNNCFIDYAKAFDCVDHKKLWEILKQMGIPDHLACLLRNLYAGQEATVRTRHGTTDWFQIGKAVRQGCILSSCLFTLFSEYI